jgi:hypothetical protein
LTREDIGLTLGDKPEEFRVRRRGRTSDRQDYNGARRSASGTPGRDQRSRSMNEEAFNLSIRKFLKVVGISAQRDQHAVAKALAERLARWHGDVCRG